MKRKSRTTGLTSDAAAANSIGTTAKPKFGRPHNAPQAPQIQLHSDHIKLLIIVTVIPQCVPHLLLFTVTMMASL